MFDEDFRIVDIVELAEPVKGHTHVLVSTTDLNSSWRRLVEAGVIPSAQEDRPSLYETMVFYCDADGNVAPNWDELQSHREIRLEDILVAHDSMIDDYADALKDRNRVVRTVKEYPLLLRAWIKLCET